MYAPTTPRFSERTGTSTSIDCGTGLPAAATALVVVHSETAYQVSAKSPVQNALHIQGH